MRELMFWFSRPSLPSFGLNPLELSSVRSAKTRTRNTVISQLVKIRTPQRKTATTISVDRLRRFVTREKTFGTSESVMRKTVGISAPRYCSYGRLRKSRRIRLMRSLRANATN